jgi:hypothetical protein
MNQRSYRCSVRILWIRALVLLAELSSNRWKDLKCVVRRRRRRQSPVPIEFPRKYISFNFMCRVSNNLRTTAAY